MKKTLSLIILLFSFQHLSFSQDQHLIDSLQTLLKTARQDTNRVKILFRLSNGYLTSNYDSSFYYAQQCLTVSERIGFKKGIGNAYINLSTLNRYKGNYRLALDYLQKSLTIFKEAGNKQGIANYYYALGTIYSDKGNYSESIKNYLNTLKIYEELGDKDGIGDLYNTIGAVYNLSGNNKEAEKNYLVSLKLKEETSNKTGIAAVENNLGIIYIDLGEYDKALSAFLKSKKTHEQTGNKEYLINALINIGEVYVLTDNYKEALINFQKALKLIEELGNKGSLAELYNQLCKLYEKQGNFRKSLEYANKGLFIAKEFIILNSIKESYKSLVRINAKLQNYKAAYDNQLLFMQVYDTIENNEKENKLTSLKLQYDFDKNETLAKAEQEKKDIKQRNIRYSMGAGLAGLIIFLMVAYWQRNKISKAKKISEEERKKAEAEKKRSEELLLNILPYEVAEELKATGTAKAKTFSMVSVMFTDFKDFTKISEKVSAELLVNEIHYCYSAFDAILERHQIEKIKTIGDSYMCASGLPVLNYTHAEDLVNAAIEILNFIQERKKEKEAKREIAFELRIGIHTGAVVAGIVGVKKFAYDIWGDTVNIAARMEQNSEAGRINISGSTYELVKDKFNCVYRGKIEAKNKGEVEMYFVETIS